MMDHTNLKEPQTTIYTIGFAQKAAKEFFSSLSNNNIRKLIDIRLNNTSQLAGFAKKHDLEYFLEKICNIKYVHKPDFAPTQEILDNYKKKIISWVEYEKKYLDILSQLDIKQKITFEELNMSCLLCSEPKPDFCHRRLLAEYFKNLYKEIEIKHI